MNAFLSIDLDYWSRDSLPHAATRFFRRLYQRFGRKIMVAVHHHHLLDHVNNRGQGYDTLINVDFHSDLDGEQPNELTEANWVNFVNFREKGSYIWRYPNGHCLNPHTGFCHLGDNPFEHNLTGWANVRMQYGLARIPWDSIREVGICLSPGWLNGNQSAVYYPIETLDLFDWAARWWVYDDLSTSVCSDIEDGVGIYRPRLTRPKHVV